MCSSAAPPSELPIQAGSTMNRPRDFDAIFSSKPSLTYSQQGIDQIIKNRRQLENELFVDKLLKVVGGPEGKHCNSQSQNTER